MLHRPFLVAAVLAGVLQSLPAQVRWTASYDQAIAAAKSEGKVLLFAFNMAGERANDEMVADHYRDPVLGRLSQHTINVFCSQAAEARVPGVSPNQQQSAEVQARLTFLKIGPGEDVIAPQHVFVHPDGTVISSVPYRITKGELEWVWVDAIRKVDPKFVWQLSPAARAPQRLGFGEVERGENQKPPTKAQVQEALKAVRKSFGAALRNLQQIELLLRSDEPEAVDYVESTLKGLSGAQVVPAIETMGVVSPKVYHRVLVGYLDAREVEVQKAAARALESMAEPKAFPALARQYKVEKDDEVRGRLLRAMASCGPVQKEAIAQIDKVLQKDPSATVRAHAVLALAMIDDKAKVHEGLAGTLRDGSAKVRATTAYALASRRDAEFAHRLDEAASREEDPETKAWLTEAAAVVRGGSGDAFDRFPERVLGETPVRAGLSRLGGLLRGGGLPGGGGGAGGGGGNGGG